MDAKTKCEATQASVEVPTAEKPADLLFCIEHGRMEKVERATGTWGPAWGHVFDNGGEADFCFFDKGWAYSPPSVFDDWTPDQPDFSDEEQEQAQEVEEIDEWVCLKHTWTLRGVIAYYWRKYFRKG